MIQRWILTGDTHGQFSRFENLDRTPNTAVIILGDAGLNYHGDERDKAAKKYLSKFPHTFYCVKGNHEMRPGKVHSMHLVKDPDVGGVVWVEEEFPNIRYFCDWGFYYIDGMKTLVIGGAYSVDKHYRLQNGWKWFEDEQLQTHDMKACEYALWYDKDIDLVLSHTCPLSLQPTDAFLSVIDQSTVDNTMETWMEKISNTIRWKYWLWGHYHIDRIEWPHCECFYKEMEPLTDIIDRWNKYDETGKLDWWLPLSPKMKRIMEEK